EVKARELGLDLDGPALGDVLDELKRLEHRGYHFEAADASLELLMRRAAGWEQDFFQLESFRVIVERMPQPGQELHPDVTTGEVLTEATVKLNVGGQRIVAVGEGNGPVNALDEGLRHAIGATYPQLASIHLTDFKVRVLDTARG